VQLDGRGAWRLAANEALPVPAVVARRRRREELSKRGIVDDEAGGPTRDVQPVGVLAVVVACNSDPPCNIRVTEES